MESERLSPRRQAVLALVADGLSNKEIAIALQLSKNTVKSYVEDILQILDVPNRAAAGAMWAAAQARREFQASDDPRSAPPA